MNDPSLKCQALRVKGLGKSEKKLQKNGSVLRSSRITIAGIYNKIDSKVRYSVNLFFLESNQGNRLNECISD